MRSSSPSQGPCWDGVKSLPCSQVHGQSLSVGSLKGGCSPVSVASCCLGLFPPHREVSGLTLHPSPRRCLTETPETLWVRGSSCWPLRCAQSGLTPAYPHCRSTNRTCCSGNGTSGLGSWGAAGGLWWLGYRQAACHTSC